MWCLFVTVAFLLSSSLSSFLNKTVDESSSARIQKENFKIHRHCKLNEKPFQVFCLIYFGKSVKSILALGKMKLETLVRHIQNIKPPYNGIYIPEYLFAHAHFDLKYLYTIYIHVWQHGINISWRFCDSFYMVDKNFRCWLNRRSVSCLHMVIFGLKKTQNKYHIKNNL